MIFDRFKGLRRQCLVNGKGEYLLTCNVHLLRNVEAKLKEEFNKSSIDSMLYARNSQKLAEASALLSKVCLS